jgi:hypothetical protein
MPGKAQLLATLRPLKEELCRRPVQGKKNLIEELLNGDKASFYEAPF